jgi:hypothetical protein
MRKLVIPCLVSVSACFAVVLAGNSAEVRATRQLPPIETFVLEPIEIENIAIWVPAGRSGPMINRSCRVQEGCSYTCMLPASVNHSKSERCPEEVARLLAEHTACYHEDGLPLTIFNGWQWEYSYSLGQFESGTYALPERGGCWESSWEAVLTQSTGSAGFQWLHISSAGRLIQEAERSPCKTDIEVRTFNLMRTRDGYPKKRKL